ncbi:MAG: molybdopterin-synthase adenylyltransferase MoeB [Gammaproteobacteria bacterium]|jgi:adenylyltransferase/sulfurtransferase|nr:molybdopterin-synthase adenylyltransferase MoeB [Gammaproteobacteria bacterium]
MNEAQRERYSRQIRLPWIGPEGQQRLLDARVFVVGMGGLGSPAAMYLAAAGVGHLAINDFDRVDASNLQRQIIHRTSDIGSGKVESARDTLREINTGVRVTAIGWQLEGGELDAEVDKADVVLDCSDNFPTRFALNAACVARGTPLVSGAAIRAEAQIVTFLPADPQSPCYRCLYEEGDESAETCAAEGVVAPLVGIVGSMQAMEAVKIIVGAGRTLCGRLLLLDALTMAWRELRLPRAPDCPVCSRRP